MKLKNSMRVILQLLLFIAIVGGSAELAKYMIKNKKTVEPEPVVQLPPRVKVLEVQTQSMTLDVRAQGEVRPRSSGRLVAEVAGRVMSVSPALVSGGFFAEGEELVQLERADYELVKTRAQARLAQADLALQQAGAEADVALREWEATGSGEASDLTLRRPQLARAQADHAAAEADLAQADLDLGRTTVRAPYAGRVRSETVDPGLFVQRGEMLAEIYAIDAIEVRLAVPDSALQHLDMPLGFRLGGAGQAVEAGPAVTLSALFAGQLRHWQGRIVRTEGELDPRTRMVILIARVSDPYGLKEAAPGTPLAVGLFVQAQIAGRRLDEALILPRAALQDSTSVLVVDVADRLRFRTIAVLWSDELNVVVSGDLQPGEQVCLTRLEAPVDGMTVTVDPTAFVAGIPTLPASAASASPTAPAGELEGGK